MDSTSLDQCQFLVYHILARKLLDLSDKELIYLGSDRNTLIQILGKHKYLTLGQKKLIDTILNKVSNRLDLFKIVDKDFSPPWRVSYRKKRNREVSLIPVNSFSHIDDPTWSLPPESGMNSRTLFSLQIEE